MRTTRTIEPTHYCDYDAPGKYLVRSLCGRLMHRAEHVTDPTCARCLAVLAARDQLVVE
jgi:hypothetical protein